MESKTKFGELDWKLPVFTHKGHPAKLIAVIKNTNPMVVQITNPMTGLQYVKCYPPSGLNWGKRMEGVSQALDLTNTAPQEKQKKKRIRPIPSKGEKLKMLAEMGITKKVVYGKKDDLGTIERRKQEGYIDYYDGQAIRDADEQDRAANERSRKTGDE